ncbi:hypothetical protein C8R45DRAFT_1003907 [Mycena sanguinolenta]|nr:hypothetical protein C8R45DRAFT_1003907 [Mycena sanguinolenta]
MQAGNNEQNGRFTSSWPFISRARALAGNTSAIRRHARQRRRARTPKLSQVARALDRLRYHMDRFTYLYLQSCARRCRMHAAGCAPFSQEPGEDTRARYGVGPWCADAQMRSAYDLHTCCVVCTPTDSSRTGNRERVTGWSRESGWCADAPRHANDLRCHLLTSRTFHWSHGSITRPLEGLRSRERLRDVPCVRHAGASLPTQHPARTKTALSGCARRVGRGHTTLRVLYGVGSTTAHVECLCPPSRSDLSTSAPVFRCSGTPCSSASVDAARARASTVAHIRDATPPTCENPMDLSISSCISHATDGNSCVARTRLATRESGARARRRTESLASAGKDGAP